MRGARHIARIVIRRTRLGIGGKARKKETQLGSPRRRWVYDIKMDLRLDEMVWAGFILFRIRTSGGLFWQKLWVL
jgi:hypothetical protein